MPSKEGFLHGYVDATSYGMSVGSTVLFPPRVRGCYPTRLLSAALSSVSSTGTWMLRVSMKRDVFTISFLLAYADAIAPIPAPYLGHL